MTNRYVSIIAGAAMLALSGAANAQQPLTLTAGQMDSVTAGGVGIANAVSLALGDVASDTVSLTSTNVSTVTPKIAIGQAFSQALAASYLFQAAAISHADTAASLP